MMAENETRCRMAGRFRRRHGNCMQYDGLPHRRSPSATAWSPPASMPLLPISLVSPPELAGNVAAPVSSPSSLAHRLEMPNAAMEEKS